MSNDSSKSLAPRWRKVARASAVVMAASGGFLLGRTLEIFNGSTAHWVGLVLGILLILMPIIGVWQPSHPLGDR
jgi:uncharacterized membrane protein